MMHSWLGALAYTMQIYFDFSGYSDMALGISFMFGIRLPLNFASPYQAASIIEFWRRWHMTLSRFLRDYLYIPLGGSRCSAPRRYTNLMATMLLGGLWHGAAWTYVAWGGLHGFFLAVNHGWDRIKPTTMPAAAARIAGVFLTFLCVTVAWVFFRATSLESALALLRGMSGTHGLVMADAPYISNQQILGLFLLMGICWFAPNAYQILGEYHPALQTQPSRIRVAWRPSPAWAAGLGIFAALALSQMLSGSPSEFIYFQF
jgi:D-alanyl-lipoteichoic acid acyltransferase DltB (MBOAT superfamily)